MNNFGIFYYLIKKDADENENKSEPENDPSVASLYLLLIILLIAAALICTIYASLCDENAHSNQMESIATSFSESLQLLPMDSLSGPSGSDISVQVGESEFMYEITEDGYRFKFINKDTGVESPILFDKSETKILIKSVEKPFVIYEKEEDLLYILLPEDAVGIQVEKIEKRVSKTKIQQYYD